MAIDRSRWTPRGAAGRLVEVAREGPRSLWFKLLGETVYRRLTVFELPLGESLPSPPTPAGVSAGRLAREDIPDYLVLRPDATGEELLERMRRGDACFVARLDGRLVSSSWVARNAMWSSYLARDISLAADESCTYETYTDRSVRGLGIGPVVRAAMVGHLREAGCRRLLATIMPENPPGIRMVEKLGYRPIGTIGFVSIGPWRRDFCRMRAGEPAPGAAPTSEAA